MSTEVQNKNANTRAPGSVSTGPERGGIILTSLILVAAVANETIPFRGQTERLVAERHPKKR